jgi:hypothetical protein
MILERYQYQVERQDTTQQYTFFETRWRVRNPFPDEREQGVASAMNRVTIRVRAMGVNTLAQVEFLGETRVRLAETNEWRQDMLTEMAEEYLQEIADALRQEFSVRIRVRR